MIFGAKIKLFASLIICRGFFAVIFKHCVFLWRVFKRGLNETMRKSNCWIIHSIAEKKSPISENLNHELNDLIRGHLCAYWCHLYSLRDDAKLLFLQQIIPLLCIWQISIRRGGDPMKIQPIQKCIQSVSSVQCVPTATASQILLQSVIL